MNGRIHAISIALFATAALLLVSGCEKKDANGSEGGEGRAALDCAAEAKGIGGATVAPLSVQPLEAEVGACYRSLAYSLSNNGVWNGTFAGPVETEGEWTAFMRGQGTLPHGLRIVIGGLEGDGGFEIVAPNAAQRPEAGKAMLFFDLEGAKKLDVTEIEADLSAVEGSLEVTGFREAEYGPPHMVAKIEATLRTTRNGKDESESIRLTTTLEVE